MKFLFKILAFIPLGIELLLMTLISDLIGAIMWISAIPSIILLALIGFSIISKQKLIQQIGIGALIILTMLLCISGYYDYFKWFSSIVGIINFIYFLIIIAVIKKINNNSIW